MKTSLIPATFVLFAAFAGSAAVAQMAAPQSAPAPVVRQHPVRTPHRAAMRLSRKLGLSPDQTARIEPILAERQQKRDALNANPSLTDAQRMEQKHALAKQTRMQMASVLTPDQLKQLRAMHRAHQQQQANAPAAM